MLAFPCFIELAVAFAVGMQWRWDSVEMLGGLPIVATVTLAYIAWTAVHTRPPPSQRSRGSGCDSDRVRMLAVVLVVGLLLAERVYLLWYRAGRSLDLALTSRSSGW